MQSFYTSHKIGISIFATTPKREQHYKTMSSSRFISFVMVLTLSSLATTTESFTAIHHRGPLLVNSGHHHDRRLRNPMVAYNTAASSTTQLAMASERREVFGLARRVIGVVTASLFNTLKSPSPARAAIVNDNTLVNGRTITFTVMNLGGEEGKTGTFKVQTAPEWAPRGVARFEELTDVGFWSNCRFFRVLPGFVAQFGINGDPAVQRKWRESAIPDDPVKATNERGTVVFATAGPNTRTTQLFINTREQGNAFLDNQGFSPIGRVIDGMEVVDAMYAGYGEGAPAGRGPNQGLIQLRGNDYLKSQYPMLSYIVKAE
jgi:peptidyl-prolyl cis-trans isomerase A (cyclophilin A)